MAGTLLDLEPVVLDELDFEPPCTSEHGDVRCEAPADVAVVCRGCNGCMAMLCDRHLRELRFIITVYCAGPAGGVECTLCGFFAPDLEALAHIIPVREGSL